jgi:phage recombination protein Bet
MSTALALTAEIETSSGKVTLTPEIIRKYLVSGTAPVSDSEIVMFINLCKFQRLNPFLREVYLVKYSDKAPASMVTGKETFLKRAMRNPKYRGHKTGISEDGKMAWAEVYVHEYAVPIRCEVDYDEYVATKDEWVNNKPTGRKIPNKTWAEKPKTMLKKVALVQALREAFPEDLGGMYSQEEINSIQETLPEKPVVIQTEAEVETVKMDLAAAAKKTEPVAPEPVDDKPPFDPSEEDTSKTFIKQYIERAKKKGVAEEKELRMIIDTFLQDVVGKDFNDLTGAEYKQLLDTILKHYADKKLKAAAK